MKPIDYLMLTLGAASLVIAALESMGRLELRIPPGAMLLLALVFVGRALLRIKLRGRERQRQMMLREIPRRPLGIADDDQP
jgi:hypothetical protein